MAKRSKGPLSAIRRVRTFESLRYRNYRYMWFSQISNSAALWMEQVARPILVIDMVGGDPTLAALHVSGVLASRTLPQFGFGLIAGVLADWYDRRTLILASKVIGMLINFAFAIVLLTGMAELWHVYLTGVLRGIATSFDNPARQALIPSLVPPEHLSNAVALNSASMQTMRIGAASIAGISLALIGVSGTFLAVAIISVGAVIFTYLMRVPPMPHVENKSMKGGVASLWEGLVYCWQTESIRAVLLLTLTFFTLGMAYLQVFAPLFAKVVLNIGDAGYGMLVAVTGVGSLAGSLTVATLSPSKRRGPMMVVFTGVLGIVLILFGASTYLPGALGDQWIATTFIVVIFLGALQSSYLALGNTLLLEQAPVEKRGRVMGVLSQDRSMITLGATLAGILSAAFGPQIAQMLFGVGLILCAGVIASFLPIIRKVD
ncbi:MAG: MFS transporter [Dehalococcoidia bacterium]|nr:MFS transporter [Dehalococcoidia bacterium]